MRTHDQGFDLEKSTAEFQDTKETWHTYSKSNSAGFKREICAVTWTANMTYPMSKHRIKSLLPFANDAQIWEIAPTLNQSRHFEISFFRGSHAAFDICVTSSARPATTFDGFDSQYRHNVQGFFSLSSAQHQKARCIIYIKNVSSG